MGIWFWLYSICVVYTGLAIIFDEFFIMDADLRTWGKLEVFVLLACSLLWPIYWTAQILWHLSDFNLNRR